MKHFFKNTETGRSMVEVMGYMVVSMFLIAGVAKIVTSAYGEYKLSQASMQLSDLAKTIVKVSAADTDYRNTIENIKDYLPKSYRVVGDNIYNVFGGQVEIRVPDYEFSGHPGDQFSITYSELDRDQCIALMTKDWINNRVVDLDYIRLENEKTSTSGKYWYWPVYHPASSGDYELPVKMADVAGTDGKTDDSGNALCLSSNKITWVFN